MAWEFSSILVLTRFFPLNRILSEFQILSIDAFLSESCLTSSRYFSLPSETPKLSKALMLKRFVVVTTDFCWFCFCSVELVVLSTPSPSKAEIFIIEYSSTVPVFSKLSFREVWDSFSKVENSPKVGVARTGELVRMKSNKRMVTLFN